MYSLFSTLDLIWCFIRNSWLTDWNHFSTLLSHGHRFSSIRKQRWGWGSKVIYPLSVHLNLTLLGLSAALLPLCQVILGEYLNSFEKVLLAFKWFLSSLQLLLSCFPHNNLTLFVAMCVIRFFNSEYLIGGGQSERLLCALWWGWQPFCVVNKNEIVWFMSIMDFRSLALFYWFGNWTLRQPWTSSSLQSGCVTALPEVGRPPQSITGRPWGTN